ncbi:MAG TPA: hypothetical protein VEH27_00705 [Methylomirabilota bacterium]|nr:hypothetical protein [Methylomirabilota bacterium]
MSPEDEKESDDLHDKLKLAAATLGEHFDSVQIIATKHYGATEEYMRFCASSGNLYANLGAVKEWIISQDQRAVNEQIRKDAQ